MAQPVIIVHGGAWAIPDALVADHLAGCRQAAARGLSLLLSGASAQDAVEQAVIVLEDHPVFDAGRGSFLNALGAVEMDAAMMRGADLAVGAIAGLSDRQNPITVARRVMASEHVFLIGQGASAFAERCGIPACVQDDLVVPREREQWRRFQERPELAGEEAFGASDTVGAIALDAQGHLCVGVSTGGRPFKVVGRVGDVPCVVCGFYADDGIGAAVSTGDGESISRIVMAKRAVDSLARGRTPQAAAEEAIAYLGARVGGRAGIIVLDAAGQLGHSHSTPRMARAWSDGLEIIAQIEPS